MCRLKSKAKISLLFYQGQVALFFFGGSFGFGVQPTILIGKRVEVPSVEFPFYQRSDIRLHKGITVYGESSEAKVPFRRGVIVWAVAKADIWLKRRYEIIEDAKPLPKA